MLCKVTKTDESNLGNLRPASLPKSNVELNALLMDMGICRENNFACLITDIKTGNDALDKWFDEHRTVDIDELNHIAGKMSKLDSKELEQFSDIIKCENPKNGIDFINIMYNRENYIIHENITDMAELGKETAFRIYGFDEDTPIGMCVDYTEFGESFHDAHGGTFQDGKYIIPPAMPNIAYNGLDFPWDGDKNPDLLLAVYVTTYEKIREYGDETPSGIWLELPATQYTIARTAHRLGADTVNECCVYTQESNRISFNDERIFAPNGSLYEINAIAEILSSYRERAMLDKFNAVLEYEGWSIHDLQGAISAAYNLDCYEHDPEIETAEDFVLKCYDNDPVKLAEADELDGEKLLAECGGKITRYGFVVAKDNTEQAQDYIQQFSGM